MRSFFSKIVPCCNAGENGNMIGRKNSGLVPNSLSLRTQSFPGEPAMTFHVPTVVVVDIDSWDSDDESHNDKTLVKTETVGRSMDDTDSENDSPDLKVAAGSVPSTNRVPPVQVFGNKAASLSRLDMVEYTFSERPSHQKHSSQSDVKIPTHIPISISVSSPSGITREAEYSDISSQRVNTSRRLSAEEKLTTVPPPVLQHVQSSVSGRVVARLNGKRARVGGAWKKRKLKRTDQRSSAVIDEA